MLTLRTLLLAIVASVLTSCAPLSSSIVSLEGADARDPSAVAMIGIDPRYPLIVRGVDGKLLRGLCVESALRSCAFVAAPGSHTLWVSSAPFGIPLVVQSIRCYAIDVVLAAGSRYTLRDDPELAVAVVLGPGIAEPVAVGHLVDKPLVIERNCRWRQDERQR